MPNNHTGLPPSQEFPSVPYGPTDFHCERSLNSWTDPLDLNAGWLDGLVDLNTERDNVQQRIADYLTDLLGIGFSGFRVDAGKHIRPDDLAAIFGKLKANMGGALPADFIVWIELLLGGEADMLLCNPDSGYNYATYFVSSMQQQGLSATEIDQIKIWYSAYPKEPDVDCGQLSMVRKAIQNDDADQQTPGSSSRDMGDDGSVLVKDRDPDKHRQFEEILFQNPYGAQDNDNDYPIRMVLSSFYFDIAQQPYGLPDGWSDCSHCTVQCNTCQNSMNYTKAYDVRGGLAGVSQLPHVLVRSLYRVAVCMQPNAQSYVGSVYTYVHRDAGIVAAMQSWMHISANETESTFV
jgi:alpha-amylase